MRIAFSKPFLILLLLASCLTVAGAPPQKSFSQLSASERRLLDIHVVGSKRYSEKDIAAASGLQLGTSITEDELKQGARRLGDMGVFTDIGYTYSYTSEGTKLTLKVTDATKFVPVRFEDFVWFSEPEMMAMLKQHVPLFNGELPLSGKLADEVSDVLQAMLVERAIPGHVEYTRAGKSDGPVDAIVYQVSDVLIQVRNIEFTGAGQAELPALKAASQRLSDREYSRTVLNSLAQKQLLPVYHSRGYLKASFGPPEPKVVKQPSETNDDLLKHLTIVDVTFAVTPGQQYKLKGLEWTGNKEFSTEALQKMVRADVGQPANIVRISDNLKDVQNLYGSRGYVTATLKAEAEFDDTAGTVVIHIGVKEGPVFHMGDLEYRGLDNSLTAKLRNAWKLRPGDVYDATYLSEYLPAARKLLPTTLDWEVSSHVTANVGLNTVDVDLIYAAKAPR